MGLPSLRAFAEQPWPGLLGLSALVHAMLLSWPYDRDLPMLCGGGWAEALLSDPSGAVRAWTTFIAFPGLALGWLLMLAAMMPPLLAWPLMHVWRSSLRRRRWRAVAIFIAAYGLLWMLAGVPMVLLALLARLLTGNDAALLWIAVAGALVWSASPWQRAALNRGHRLSRIGARGWKADRDALRFGAYHAKWCILSCWPWMLVPLVAGRWHIAVMASATIAMLLERLAQPARPRWRMPASLSALPLPDFSLSSAKERHA